MDRVNNLTIVIVNYVRMQRYDLNLFSKNFDLYYFISLRYLLCSYIIFI